MGATLGVDMSSVGETEVPILQQILVVESTIASSPGGGITQLTGDVTAGPGSGSVAATVAALAGITVSGSLAAGTFLYNNAGTLAGGSGLSINGGAISAITIAESANVTGLTISGGLVNGSGTTSFASISGTWNTGGVVTGFSLAVTETLSGAGSKLFQILGGAAGATSEFSVLAGGAGIRINGGTEGMVSLGAGQLGFMVSSTTLGASVTSTSLAAIGGVSASSLVAGNGNLTKAITLSHDGTNATIDAVTGWVSIVSGTAFQLGNAATTGLIAGALAALTTASVVIKDSTGQSYRVPCIV